MTVRVPSNPSVWDGAHWDQMKDEIGSLCMPPSPAGLEINTRVIFSSVCQTLAFLSHFLTSLYVSLASNVSTKITRFFSFYMFISVYFIKELYAWT